MSKIKKYRVILSVLISIPLIYSCCPDHSLLVYNKGKNAKVLINQKEIDNYVCDEKILPNQKISYYLSLKVGENNFEIHMNDNSIIDTTIMVGGELYLGIDFESKKITGF